MTKNYEIREGRTETEVASQNGNVIAVHPFYGPANSRTLKTKIIADGLIESTFREVAIVANALYKGEESQAQELTKIMRNRYFRAFTGIHYDAKTKLAYFVDYPEFDENSFVDNDDLARRVKSSPDKFRTVPLSEVREREIDWGEVAKHPYMIAFAGEEGAENIAELASKHPAKKVYLWVPNVSDLKESISRVAALDSDAYGNRLYVNGDDLGSFVNSSAFGVRRGGVGEADASKILTYTESQVANALERAGFSGAKENTLASLRRRHSEKHK